MKKTVRMMAVLLITVVLVLAGLNSCTAANAWNAERETGGRALQNRVTRILVLGCDRAVSLADSIFLVTVDETLKDATILQIPRDTYAEYTDRSYKKINGAPGALGVQHFKQFLEQPLLQLVWQPLEPWQQLCPGGAS